MSKTVVYTSCSRISCASSELPEVILCLDSDTLLTSGRSTLAGVLSKTYKLNEGCDRPYWRYVITYDETLLVDPTVALTADNIEGIFCQGCLTVWVEDQLASLGGAGAFKYVYPSTIPTVGQVLTVSAVADNVVTLVWA